MQIEQADARQTNQDHETDGCQQQEIEATPAKKPGRGADQNGDSRVHGALRVNGYTQRNPTCGTSAVGLTGFRIVGLSSVACSLGLSTEAF